MALVMDTMESIISALLARMPYHARVSHIMWRRESMKGISVSTKAEESVRGDHPIEGGEYMQSWNEYMKEYWRKNPEKYEIHKRQMRKNTKIWNSRHKERKRECSKIWRLNHLEQCRLLHEYSKRKTLEMRLEIFRLLGNKCSNPHCLIPNGCQDRRCLQIDHVHGHGTREVKKFKGRIPYYKFILNQIKEGSRDYQLLCANCNWIKRVERNEVAFGSTKGI